MAVVRMVIDVRQRGASLGWGAAEERVFDLLPLNEDGRSLALAAAVAASCGVRPSGFLSEMTSRPGRRVQGWGAVLRAEAAVPPGAWPAEPPASIAGMILLAESAPSGGGPTSISIPWLLVRPESRRMGIGRALVAAVLERAQDRGATVSIDTLDRWPEAVAFWRGMGFMPVGSGL